MTKPLLTWNKKDDTVALGQCVECPKTIKKGEIFAELYVKRTDPYTYKELDFCFYLHKRCLILFLQDCPFESVEVLKSIDLNQLDKP